MSEEKNKKRRNIRNVGLIAHIDAGKTTVTERFLYNTGRIHQIGEVHDGDATMDYMDQEKERGITISSAATQFEWDNLVVNLIDTPGHVDFTVEVERCLRVLDGAVGIFCAVGGVESQSETVWQQANRYGVPRIAFVNKLDRMGADFESAIEQMSNRLEANPVPLYWPLSTGEDFSKVLDILNEQVLIFRKDPGKAPDVDAEEVPEQHQDLLDREQERLFDAAADQDEQILETVLGGQKPDTDRLHKALRKGTLNDELTPVFCGSALRNQGIQPLLEGIEKYLPAPHEREFIRGTIPGSGQSVKVPVRSSGEGSLAAMAFKSHSSTTGDLTFLRIYSGQIETGDKVYNPRTDTMERIGRMAVLHAEEKESVEQAQAGDIVGVVGLKNTGTGDTVCDPDNPVALGSMDVPQTVISLAVDAKDRNERDRLAKLLSSVSREDPSFEVRTDNETGEYIISGMGELHLEVVMNRIEEEHDISIDKGAPRVSYRKTLRDTVDVEVRHKKQTGGRGEFAECEIMFEPVNLNGEVEFEETIRGGVIPEDFIPAVEKGIRSFAEDGGDEDIPLVNFRAHLYDGDHHSVDSSEVAFQTAGRKAIQKAVERTGLIILEPLMELVVECPKEDMGDVVGYINTRRADVREVEQNGNKRRIHAEAPLAELFQFATNLRSLTEGRGSYTMEFKRYAPVPEEIHEEIMAERTEKTPTKV